MINSAFILRLHSLGYNSQVPYTQCAAVMAQVSATMVAPHRYPAELYSISCHGHCPLVAS